MKSEDLRKSIYVYSHDINQEGPLLMGVLNSSEIRGKEIFSFEYDKDFLNSHRAFQIDPNLQLLKGSQYLPVDKINFGLFLDSAPDRWGRVLMDRREAMRARLDGRSPKRLWESDYLLGVFDETRMGALRFRTAIDGPFLDNDSTYITPPITSLRELEQASQIIEDDQTFGSQQYYDQLALLVAPGSSLGGARPKANVKNVDGVLWIAKFPSRNDMHDQGAWEYLTYKLAIECGIEMAESKAETYLSNHHTFLTRRFDRDEAGSRIQFFSAMTLLGYRDGDDAQTGVSYLELADLIIQRGCDVDQDLEQLWRRIVFNICVSNTDDHLRNHGFLLTSRGLRLSPAYDINPNPKGYGLSLNIDELSNELKSDLALQVAPYFRIKADRANSILNEINSTVKMWDEFTSDLKLSRNEKDMMAPAFDSV